MKLSDRLIWESEIKKREHDVVLKDGALHRCFDTTMLSEIPTVDAEPVAWIPITSRPMDDEERNEWSEKLGYDIAYDDGEALIYTSQLPDDGQEVLVCGRYGRVWIDTFMNDPDYGCYLEENGDMDGIVAWMPLPKPYREKEREDAKTD